MTVDVMGLQEFAHLIYILDSDPSLAPSEPLPYPNEP